MLLVIMMMSVCHAHAHNKYASPREKNVTKNVKSNKINEKIKQKQTTNKKNIVIYIHIYICSLNFMLLINYDLKIVKFRSICGFLCVKELDWASCRLCCWISEIWKNVADISSHNLVSNWDTLYVWLTHKMDLISLLEEPDVLF